MINTQDVKIEGFGTYIADSGKRHVEYHVNCRGKRFYTRCSASMVGSIVEAKQDFITHSNKLDYFEDIK